MQLITFHFAGGNKFSFNALKKYIPASINLISTEFPGRNNTQELTPYIHQIVDHIYPEVLKHVHKPYAFFGHSMGSTVSYLVTRRILADGHNPPAHLFVSGRMGPSFPFLKDGFHRLPKEEFRKEVKKLNGIPEEIYSSSTAMDYFEPFLRADFAAIESYVYHPAAPFHIPVTVMYGSDEGMDERILDVSWQKETTVPIQVHRFAGGHFFIYNNWEEIAQIFRKKLQTPQLINN